MAKLFKKSFNILNLHEELIRNIFGYLDNEEVYLTVRNVCLQFKEYVDDYLQLGGSFMLSYGPGTPTRIMHVLKKNGKLASICYSNFGSPIPWPNAECSNNGTRFYFGGGSFGCTLNGRIFVGIYYWEENKNFPVYSHHSYYYDKSKLYLLEYNLEEKVWFEIRSSDDKKLATPRCANTLLTTCRAENSILVSAYVPGLSTSMVRHDFYTTEKFSKQNKFEEAFFKESEFYDCNKDKCNMLSTLTFQIKEEPIEFEGERKIQIINECAIVPSGNNELILVGGKSDHEKLNRTLWMLELTKMESCLGKSSWKAVNLWNSIKPRIRPICFRLKHNLFIAGGQTLEEVDECRCESNQSMNTNYLDQDRDGILKCFVRDCNSKNKWTSLLCCDRYNILERKYEESVCFLPYPIHDVDKIDTDADESFAVITRRNSGKCLIFTEEEGFKELPNSIIGENPCHPWGYYTELRSDNRIFFRI